MSMPSLQYAGTLMGREAVIDFPDSRASVRYTPMGEMLWRVVDSQGKVSEGHERLSYLQLDDNLHFLNWMEKAGFTVSQLIDVGQGTVQAFWSYAEPGGLQSHKISMVVVGRFRFC